MMIVWGHNNFRLKSVDAAALGIFDTTQGNYTFELRQKYAHLFWIPIFPLGKIWTVKKPDTKLYHCPADLDAALRQQFPARTSIWAWTGPLLVLLGIVIVSINQKVSDHRRHEEAKESFAQANLQLANKINNAIPGDYLQLSVKPAGQATFNYDYFPAKVLAVTADSIKLGKYFIDYADAKMAEEPETIADLEMTTGLKDSFMVSKKILINAISTNYDNKQAFDGVVINGFVPGSRCRLTGISHVEGPVVHSLRLPEEKEDGSYFELVNNGFNAYADSIVADDNSNSWKLSKKRNFYNGDTIAIKGPEGTTATLYCSDKQKKVYRFNITNLGASSLQINPVEENE